MEHYKTVIKKRVWGLSALLLIVVGLGFYNVFFVTPEIQANEAYQFQCGLLIALGILSCLLRMRYRKILNDKHALLLQYNTEYDERMRSIRAKAGMPMLLISSILMMIIALFISYFNFVVFCTLSIAAFTQMLLACAMKLFYSKTM